MACDTIFLVWKSRIICKDILDSVPEQPGCYLMKDQDGKVIYIGKAINLRHRVRSYFHASAQKYSPHQPAGRAISGISNGSSSDQNWKP